MLRKTLLRVVIASIVPTLAPQIAYAHTLAQSDTVSNQSVAMPSGWLAQFQAEQEAGTTVLLSQHGKLLLQETLGMANLELAIPLQSHHLFRIGSISKSFVAVLALQLVEQGKLDLHRPIHYYLTGLPASWNQITAAHLLSHSSGIADYLSGPQGGYSALRGRRLSKDELIELFYAWPLQFTPGQQFTYSNSGYVVLMKLIETLAKASFAELLAQKITQPLAMQATYAQLGERFIPGLVNGYTSGSKPTFISQLDGAFADGSMISNSADLSKFAQALLEHRLLSKASWQLMSTPYRFNDGSLSDYGYGMFIRESQGHKLVGHGGDIFGFHSMLEIDTETAAIAVVMRNSDQFGARKMLSADYLSRRLLALANHRPITEPQAVTLGAEQIRALIGDFPTAQGTRSVRYQDGVFLTRLNQGREILMQASSAYELFAPQRELRLRYDLQQGRAPTLQTYQDEGSVKP